MTHIRSTIPVLVLLAGLGCTITKTSRDFVDVRKGTSRDQKMKIAATVVNEAALDRIKAQIKQEMPEVEDGELGRLGLTTSVTSVKSGSQWVETPDVRILVLLQNPSREHGQAILDRCKELIDAAVNGQTAKDH